MSELVVTATADGGVRFRVRVSPQSQRTAIGDVHGGALKVALRAAPEKGKANAELIKVLAKSLGTSKSDVRLTSGLSSRLKTVHVLGISTAELHKRLGH
ncbi:DUF167 domain-containing protein [Roseiconus nitratireducens]|uniref:UPF0235 protein FYK55_05980 n=1 Tax=Roseiconus nitratireducens TaxID=2605748 RepID=A0A5M6DCT8_9BACT|nr:DUF167 domain-containing protein [Roseiconus nitratireducens]KAA5545213.1 DUF167 domain-containing protein [Roseiconus nitratireducens]